MNEAQCADDYKRDLHHRQHNAQKRLKAVASVDKGRLLQLDRHLSEHRAEDDQREGKCFRGCCEDNRRIGVQNVERAEYDKHRRGQQSLGKDLQHQHDHDRDINRAVAQPAHGVGAHRAERQSNRRNRNSDDQAIAEISQDIFAKEDVLERCERRLAREKRRRIGEDLTGSSSVLR